MPTQISGSPWQSSWAVGGYPKLAPTGSGSFAVNVGDKIIVRGVVESQSALPTPTNAATGPATITWTLKGNVTTASRCWAGVWDGVVTVAGNVQVSCAAPPAGGVASGIIVNAYNAHGGLGQAPAGATGSATAPTLTATWTAGSDVLCANGDFTAGSIGTLAYRTGNGTPTQQNAVQLNTNYSTEAFDYIGSVGGSQAVGETAPTQTWSLVAIEVLAPAGNAPAPLAFDAIPFMPNPLIL